MGDPPADSGDKGEETPDAEVRMKAEAPKPLPVSEVWRQGDEDILN